MLKKLRMKFVSITMLLMIVVFGLLLTGSHLYNSYWFEEDTLSLLEWIADNKSGTDLKSGIRNDTIYEITVDKNRNIQESRAFGENAEKLPKNIIMEMVDADEDEYSIGQYIFTKRNMGDGNIIIFVANTESSGNQLYEGLSGVALIISGLALLLIICIYLSGFVMEPAQKEILREKQFIADASHELKTPLSAISINAEALKAEFGENRHIEHIISETERMDRLIKRLLTLSKIEESADDSDMTRFSLSDAVEEIALTYESVVFENNLNFSYRIKPELQMTGSEDQIKQLIALLIDNAVKNADENGNIELSLERNGDYKILKVSNSGEGISEDEIEHIFDRFYTTDSSRKGESFGLGLAIAKAIVLRHKGEISVQSERGEDTVFSVIL
ncbi:MAG: sensor histidine kinase [Anaerovoracaceae bacterium]